MWRIDQRLLSLYLLEVITFDPDVQIEKMRARWKYRDMKENLEVVSMVGMTTIKPKN
jgi:hypothetical protein